MRSKQETIIEVAKRAVFEIQKSRHLQPLAATCSHSSVRKWPQVAAWTANTSPNGPILENLKKMRFSRTAFFSSFL